MIELCSVTKTFNSGKPSRFTAVDDVSLTIRPGRLTVLKGPSGSGKTTLMTLIGCMNRPTAGRIRLHGISTSFYPAETNVPPLDITSLPERFLTEIRRNTFGFIFQQFNLVKGISVRENIMLPTYPADLARKQVFARSAELMEMLSISRHASSPVDWLSGGELQRVAIARAMINNPSVIMADEPTAHLDSALSQEFIEIVGGLKSAGKTVIIASHDPLVYDSELADTIVVMRDGRITGIQEKQ